MDLEKDIERVCHNIIGQLEQNTQREKIGRIFEIDQRIRARNEHRKRNNH